MSATLQIVLVGIGTYLVRVSAIALAGRFPEPSAAARSTMRLIAPAVIGALVADQLLVTDRAVVIRWSWLLAAVIAVLVTLRWRSAGLTVAVGVFSVWALGTLGLS